MNDELDVFDEAPLLEESYTVEKILDKKMYKGKWKYKIKWDGYPFSECTWEPVKNLSTCLKLVEKFDSKFEAKQKSKKDSNNNNVKNNSYLKNKNGIKKNEFTQPSTLASALEDFSLDKKPNLKLRKILVDEIEEDRNSEYSKTSKNSKKSESANIDNNNNNDIYTTENNVLNLIEERDNNTSTNATETINSNDNSPFNELFSSAVGNLDEDVPNKILSATILDDFPVELNCLVSWNRREDGTQPNNTWISSHILRKRQAGLLLDYYESRIRLPVLPSPKYN